MSEELKAAVAAGVVGSQETFRSLLQSVVEVARAIFGAKASSIFLLDEETDELVFEAIAGYGADTLIGQRFPSSTGIAGWVLVTRQPLVIEDVTEDPRFAKDFAETTGYVPKGLMAVPLLHEERALGVLEVLDRPQRTQFSLVEMDLLGLFANQAAIALDLLRRARRAEAVLAASGEGADVLARLAATLGESGGRAARPRAADAGCARRDLEKQRGRLSRPRKNAASFATTPTFASVGSPVFAPMFARSARRCSAPMFWPMRACPSKSGASSSSHRCRPMF